MQLSLLACSAVLCFTSSASCDAQEGGGPTALSSGPAAGPAAAPATGQASGQASGQGPASAASAKPGSLLRLKKIAVADPMIGCNAFTMLIPEGWNTDGGVQWQFQWNNLATANMRVSDPKSETVLEMLPITPACHDPSLPPGTNYMGSYVIAPPRDVKQYVEAIVLPLFRSKMGGVKVGALTPLPEVARAVQKSAFEPGVAKQVDAGKVRLEYQLNGKQIEEDVYVTIVQSRSPMLPNMVQWGCEHQYAFRAEKGKLDAQAPLLQAMVSSVAIDLQWYAGYSQVIAMRNQGTMDQIRAAGELSKQISRNNDAMIASMRSSWQARQASEDRIHRQFSESIRGVETYENTFSREAVELPSGYDDVWVSSSGEYVLSNQGGYDPNVGSTLEWRRLEHAK
jgi:hypothetical protein